MTRIVWTLSAHNLFLELPEREREAIHEHLKYLKSFPHMYPARTRGRFRRHRWFQAGNGLAYYRVASGTVYIRGLWPSHIP